MNRRDCLKGILAGGAALVAGDAISSGGRQRVPPPRQSLPIRRCTGIGSASRVMDFISPSDDRPWEIEPTPIPELAQLTKGQIPTYIDEWKRTSSNGCGTGSCAVTPAPRELPPARAR